MQVAVELPNDFVAFQSVTDIGVEMRNSYALWLYKRGRITLSKAAHLAGLNLYDFIDLCNSNGIAVIDISRQELLDELAGFNAA